MTTSFLTRIVPPALLALLMGLGAPPASAFESYEHQKTSELAAELTLAYTNVPGNTDGAVEPAARAALEALKAEDYGLIVQCVDFLLSPERIFTYGWPASDAATGSAIGLPELLAGEAHIVLPKALRTYCKTEGAAYIQASHNNHSHFQQDLLLSLRLWHLMAVQLGRPAMPLGGGAGSETPGNYLAALVANAVADHYLQDLFAPGHIVTPRDKLSDLPATATHDLANRMGVVFQPDVKDGVKRILGFLCGGGLSGTPAVLSCNDGAFVPMLLRQSTDMNFADIAYHAQALISGTPTLFRGDDHLFEPEQNRQRLLMLAVQIRSILDVLQGKNHLTTAGFKYDIRKGTAAAWTDFGRYDFTDDMKRYAEVPGVLVPAGSGLAGARESGETSSPSGWKSICSLGKCSDRPYELRTRAPIVSFSAQRESQSSGAYSARNLYGIELSTFNVPLDISRLTQKFAGVVEVAPLILGWANYQQGHSRGSGPTYRAAFTIPETDVSFGPYARLLTYAPSDGVIRKLSYGLRVDTSFFGYFSFYVTGGMDYGLTEKGELQRGRLWAGGLRMGIPFTRFGEIADTLLGRKHKD